LSISSLSSFSTQLLLKSGRVFDDGSGAPDNDSSLSANCCKTSCSCSSACWSISGVSRGDESEESSMISENSVTLCFLQELTFSISKWEFSSRRQFGYNVGFSERCVIILIKCYAWCSILMF